MLHQVDIVSSLVCIISEVIDNDDAPIQFDVMPELFLLKWLC